MKNLEHAPDDEPMMIVETLSRGDIDKLFALHVVANFQGRRIRFGGGLGDESVWAYCQGIDWTRFLAVGAFFGRRMDAVAELFPLGADWREAEIAMTCSRGFAVRFAQAFVAETLFQARRKGCRSLIWVEPAPGEFWLRCLSRLAKVVQRGQDVLIEL